MISRTIVFLLALCTAYTFRASGQALASNSKDKKLSCFIIQPALGIAGWGGLYFLWYKDYPSTNFHFFNDGNQWLGMDKIGHFYSGYYLTQLSSAQYNRCIQDKSKSEGLGALSSFIFLTGIEVLDGFSQNWGASMPDFISNTAGIGLFALQSGFFGEQRIIPKFSYTRSAYSDFRPTLLGANPIERLFKDYNGQTYWLSTSIGKWKNKKHWSDVLGVSFGYGATGMLGGKENPLTDASGLAYPNVQRTTQLYFSISIDWTEIPTEKKWLQTTFKLLKGIKVPLPGLILQSNEVRISAFAY